MVCCFGGLAHACTFTVSVNRTSDFHMSFRKFGIKSSALVSADASVLAFPVLVSCINCDSIYNMNSVTVLKYMLVYA